LTDSSFLRSWLTFFGCVLVAAILYWAQAVLVPVAVALLITFVLATPVTWLERRLGRASAVLCVVVLVFAGLGLSGWGMWREMGSLAAELPGYRANIRQKIADVRHMGRGTSVERIQTTIEEIQAEMAAVEAPRGSRTRPIVVESHQVVGLWGFPAWLGPILAPLSTAGLVVVLVIFMLLERENLRDRLIGLVGHGHLTITTKAFDEAGRRVSRQLLMQSIVNGIVGVSVFVGLAALGVPYALLWAVLAAALRFVPYLGPLVGAGAPIVMSLASAPGWSQALWVVGFFVVLELFTNLVLETALYAGAAGVSQVALLIAVAFWTWLWGPAGLLMAMPLTVCLVVLGKHVRGLEFVATLLADTPPLPSDVRYYQRLLARDPAEAVELIDRHVKESPPETVYDALVLPALNYAERDRLEDRLSPEEEQAVIQTTRELMADARALNVSHGHGIVDDEDPRAPLAVTAVAVNGEADALALGMLAQLLEGAPITFEVLPAALMSSEIVARIREEGSRIVCIADLPPSAPSKTRYLIKRLRAALPDLHILVGRWAPSSLADEDHRELRDVGASHVSASLLETRDRLLELEPSVPRAERPQPPALVVVASATAPH
jgi:predicted PurR-regulated permease PerM